MNIESFGNANISALIPPVWHYATGLFSLLCLLIGMISNGLVISMFMKNSDLRQPRNYFVFNLALTDLGLLLTNNVPHVIASFKKQWIFGQAGCNFYSVCGGIFGLSSIATMATVAISRLAAVVDPFSSLKLGSAFTKKCLICSWVYGSMWIIPPLFGWNRFTYEGFGTTCTFDYMSREKWDRLFVLILATGGFLVPLSVILFSYTCILFKLNNRGRPLKSHNSDEHSFIQNPLTSNTQSPQPVSSQLDIRDSSETATVNEINESNTDRTIRHTETRARRTALIICGIFCMAWGPYAFTAVSTQFGFCYWNNPYTITILGLLTKTAACVNPLIYALSSPAFRYQVVQFRNPAQR